MVATGNFRGHPAYWDPNGRVFRFVDDNELAPNWGGDERPCTCCGLTADPDDGVGGADPCLGVLEGVDSACCGHGIEEGVIDGRRIGVKVCGQGLAND